MLCYVMLTSENLSRQTISDVTFVGGGNTSVLAIYLIIALIWDRPGLVLQSPCSLSLGLHKMSQ